MKNYLLQASDVLGEFSLHSIKLTPLHRKNQHPSRAWKPACDLARSESFVRNGEMLIQLVF